MTNGSLKPLGDRVVLQRVEAESRTPGGIVLPDSAKEKPKQGIVKAVGPGKALENGKISEMQVSEGDRVIFTSYAGTEIRVGETEYVVLSESDILAVIE